MATSHSCSLFISILWFPNAHFLHNGISAWELQEEPKPDWDHGLKKVFSDSSLTRSSIRLFIGSLTWISGLHVPVGFLYTYPLYHGTEIYSYSKEKLNDHMFQVPLIIVIPIKRFQTSMILKTSCFNSRSKISNSKGHEFDMLVLDGWIHILI